MSPFHFWAEIKLDSDSCWMTWSERVSSAAGTWDGRAWDDGNDGRYRSLTLLLFGLPQVGEALGFVGRAALRGRCRDDALGGVVVVAFHPGQQKHSSL